MVSLPGRCTNEMFCTLGASGRLVHVPDDSAYVCPVCGKPLVPPSAPRRNRLRSATLFSLGVFIAAAGAFLGGMVIAGFGLWPRSPTLAVLATRQLVTPGGHRVVASLQAPKPLVVSSEGRRRGAPGSSPPKP